MYPELSAIFLIFPINGQSSVAVITEMQPIFPPSALHVQNPTKKERLSKTFYMHIICEGLSYPLVWCFCQISLLFFLRKPKKCSRGRYTAISFSNELEITALINEVTKLLDVKIDNAMLNL